MSYYNIIQESKISVFNASIATKIMQHIMRVRDNNQEAQARRWVWELIQNAKDASYSDTPVKIKIELHKEKLVFSHNGQPFNIKSLLSIINQVSSKNPQDESTTGKFGTGFVTTHLLSEKVELTSILQDKFKDLNGNETTLDCKKFSVILDRSGQTQEEILSAVSTAVQAIEKIDQSESVPHVKGETTTHFTYFFKTQYSEKVAKIGLDDLQYSIFYALVFVKGIDSIEICDYVNNNHKSFKISNQPINSMLTNYKLTIVDNDNTSYQNILFAQKNNTQIALPVSEDKRFLKIDENTPRVFVDFPLIGSENFPFPVVCNNRDLKPNETRSYIPIPKNETSLNSQNNKKILAQSLELFFEVLSFAADNGYNDFYNICRFIKTPVRDDVDSSWIEENIWNQLFKKLTDVIVVNIGDKKVSLNNKLAFPMSSDTCEQDRIKEILLCIENAQTPVSSDLNGWYEAFRDYSKTYSYSIFYTLETLVSNISKYALSVEKIKFIQKIYDAVLENKQLKLQLESGKLALLPDQTKEINLHTVDEIFNDTLKDETIKETIEILKNINLSSKNSYEIYKILIHNDFDTKNIVAIKNAPLEQFFQYIIEASNPKATVINLSYYQQTYIKCRLKASLKLICCHPDKYYFDIANKFFDIKDYQYKATTHTQDSFFRNSLLTLIDTIISYFDTYNTLELMGTYLKEDAVEFLNNFYKKIFQISTTFKSSPIFPNENGFFHNHTELKTDYTERICEELKDICFNLKNCTINSHDKIINCKKVLLHKDINYLEAFSIDKITNLEIANQISTCINNILNTQSLSEASSDVQSACTLLLAFIEENDDTSKALFSGFYSPENRMKLLTPKSASIMTQKIKAFNTVLAEHGITDINQLSDILSNMNVDGSSSDDNEAPVKIYSNGKIYVDFSEFAEFTDWTEQQKEDYARKVGATGEKLFFEYLENKWTEKGFVVTSKNSNVIELAKDEDKVSLCFADTNHYKQAGFDFIEIYNQNNHYYEVKSTVSKERKNFLRLTNTQANKAFASAENYTVASLFLPTNLTNYISLKLFTDLGNEIKNGSLCLLQNETIFGLVK